MVISVADLGVPLSVAKRTSRLVRMPASLPLPAPRSTTGMPEIWWHRHQAQRVGQRLVGMDGDRVDHHAAFELLDLADLVGLRLGIEVLVDDADAAGLGHGDRHGASVTVSIAADISGMPSSMVRVRRVRVAVW